LQLSNLYIIVYISNEEIDMSNTEEDIIYRGYLIEEFENGYGVVALDGSNNFCICNSKDKCMDFVDRVKREQRAAAQIFGETK
jgi:hypothetical protein